MTAVQDAIQQLTDRRSLDGSTAAAALEVIMTGEATQAQIGAFLGALRVAGETPEVVAACLEVMFRHAETVPAADVLDVCGTGGDGADTFNVSTAAGIVCAAAGVRVAKHGNRAASSKCGSADLLEALGAKLDLSGAQAAEVIDRCGFCFLFAQRFHPAMRHVGGPRRELGVRTLFNVLGPLSNPARPTRQLVGVGSAGLGPIVAETLALRGLARALVVHSGDGLDEISPAGITRAWEVSGGVVGEREFSAPDFGLPAHPLASVLGGDAVMNAEMLRAVLGGVEGPVRDFTLMNSAAALYVAGLVDELPAGVERAAEGIDSGRAREVLEQYISLSNEVAG